MAGKLSWEKACLALNRSLFGRLVFRRPGISANETFTAKDVRRIQRVAGEIAESKRSLLRGKTLRIMGSGLAGLIFGVLLVLKHCSPP